MNKESVPQQESYVSEPRSWRGEHRREGWLRSIGAMGVRLGLPAVLLWAVFAFAHTSGAAADPIEEVDATAGQPRSSMTFHTGVNLLGILDSIAVQPQHLSVVPGEIVEVRNNSLVPLTVNVREHTLTVSPNSATALRFNGEEEATSLPVRATVLNVPIVGDLLSTSGSISVPAAPRPTQPVTEPSEGSSPPASDGSEKDSSAVVPLTGRSGDTAGSSEEDSSTTISEEEENTATPSAPVDEDGSAGETSTDSSAHSADKKQQGEELSAYDETSYRSLSPIDSTVGLFVAAAVVLVAGVAVAGVRVLRWYAGA